MPDERTTSHPAIPDADERTVAPNFITEIVDRDLTAGRVQEVVTRFPPEPNGYLHIGHIKAIVLDFGIAADYRGRTNLRFDDTNPTTENEEYVEAIKRDVEWLGFRWNSVVHASDYFDRLYGLARQLIEDGKAYVDSLSETEIREYRGTVTEPGRPSPYRDRDPAESLDLFERMRSGEFAEGEHVLRARIDMSSRNMIMRDPLLYRIRNARHYRTGDAWHIYPMYDFAHPLSDAIEGVTHSLCTLEFENNRELYDWVLENTVGSPRPHQYEFARLNLEFTVLSKRRLIELVRDGHVGGWDDPRMPTVAAVRRRGATPQALREFVNRVGVTKAGSRTDMALLESSIRDDLNSRAPRVMAVVEPLRVVIDNYPAGEFEELEAPYWPHDVPREGSRPLPFGRELYIERSDFSEDPPAGWRRLAPGREVRLRHAYVVRCDDVVRDESGEVRELRCSYDPDTLGSNPTGRKVWGTIHWLASESARPAEFRLYDRLFREADPNRGDGFIANLNPESLRMAHGYVEPSVLKDSPETRYQFERLGYFWPDPIDSRPDSLVFNRIVTLKDSWARGSDERQRGRTEGRDAAPGSSGTAGPAHSRAGTLGEGTAGETFGGDGTRGEVAGRGSSGAEEVRRDPVSQFTPQQKTLYTHYVEVLGLPESDASLIASSEELGIFFEGALSHHDNAGGLANWIVNELQRERKGRDLAQLAITPKGFAEMVALVDAGEISTRAAKEVFAELVERGGSQRGIVDQRGLRQLSDEGQLAELTRRVIERHPAEVESYRSGKTGLVGFFVGQIMKETGGRANPRVVKETVESQLAGG